MDTSFNIYSLRIRTGTEYAQGRTRKPRDRIEFGGFPDRD